MTCCCTLKTTTLFSSRRHPGFSHWFETCHDSECFEYGAQSGRPVIVVWLRKNAMKLNATKSQLIAFGSRQNVKHLAPISVKIADTVINESATVQNLGVIFDRHMLFDSHVNRVVRRCSGTLLSPRHTKHDLPAEVVPRLVDDLVMSSIRYCVSVYGATSGQLTQSPRESKNELTYVLGFCLANVSMIILVAL